MWLTELSKVVQNASGAGIGIEEQNRVWVILNRPLEKVRGEREQNAASALSAGQASSHFRRRQKSWVRLGGRLGTGRSAEVGRWDQWVNGSINQFRRARSQREVQLQGRVDLLRLMFLFFGAPLLYNFAQRTRMIPIEGLGDRFLERGLL